MMSVTQMAMAYVALPLPILDVGPISQLLLYSGIQRRCVLLIISRFNEQIDQCITLEVGKEGP